MTRKTWPLLLGGFVVSTVLIGACNSSTEDDEDQPGVGGSTVANTSKGGATQATGVLQRGGSTAQTAVGRGGANIFSSITPSQGSTTGRGGAANQGGAATRGGAAGNSNRGGNAGTAGRAGSSSKAGNAGMGGSGATAGTVAKGGSAGTPGDGGTTAIAGHAGSSNPTSIAIAGSSGASNPSTGGASTGGVSTGGASTLPASAGAAGGPALVKTCTDGCASVNIPFTAAAQTAEFSAGVASAVELTNASTVSITVYAPSAVVDDQIQVTLVNGAQGCDLGSQGLLQAAPSYVTLTYSTAACPSQTSAARAAVTVTSGDANSQILVFESISITDTTSGTVNWGFENTTSVGTCGASHFCAVPGTITGVLTWIAGGTQ